MLDARLSVQSLLALPSLVHLAVQFVMVQIEHLTAVLPPNLKRLGSAFRIHDDVEVTHGIDMENVQISTQCP
jgi:hypothetical protein